MTLSWGGFSNVSLFKSVMKILFLHLCMTLRFMSPVHFKPKWYLVFGQEKNVTSILDSSQMWTNKSKCFSRKSHWIIFYENYGSWSSHHSMEKPANYSCTLKKTREKHLLTVCFRAQYYVTWSAETGSLIRLETDTGRRRHRDLTVSLPSSESMSKCQEEAKQGTGKLGSFKPQCDEHGNYMPRQCWHATGFCWCVDKDGKPIEGTASRSWPKCAWGKRRKRRSATCRLCVNHYQWSSVAWWCLCSNVFLVFFYFFSRELVESNLWIRWEVG